MVNSYITLIFIVFLIFVTACNSQTSNREVLQKICIETEGSTIFECEKNELDVKYYSDIRDPNIADGPEFYFDNNGAKVGTCGYIKPYPEECLRLNEIDCKKELVICAVD